MAKSWEKWLRDGSRIREIVVFMVYIAKTGHESKQKTECLILPGQEYNEILSLLW